MVMFQLQYIFHLVGDFKHDFFHHTWDVILLIDELHHFSRWLSHHQPDTYFIVGYGKWPMEIDG